MRHRLNGTARHGTALSAPVRRPQQIDVSQGRTDFRSGPALLNPKWRRLSLTALAFVLASTLFQQSPAQPYYSQTGHWEFLTYSDGSRVRWRNAPVDGTMPDRPSQYDGAAGERLYVRDTFGIHATVLPRKVYFPGQPDGVRGAVMLWGNGTQHSTIPPQGQYPYVRAYSPYLLWHHSLHASSTSASTDRLPLGHIGYTVDPDPTETSDPEIDCANLFCSGHSLMADGSLFVAGGSQYMSGGVIQGTRACFRFDPSLWRNDSTATAHAGWSLPLGLYFTDPLQGPREGMGVKRWYPSTLLLPNKKMLIAGGTKRALGNYACVGIGQENDLNKTFQIFDPQVPPQSAFASYSLEQRDCPSTSDPGYGDLWPWFYYHPEDQRRSLGYEYPRLHGVSWTSGSPPNQTLHYRAAAAGPDPRIFLLDPESPSSGWQRFAHSPPYPWSVFHRRFSGSTVLLPRMDVMNPQGLAEQTLGTIAQIGGTDGCDAKDFDKFLTVVSVSGATPSVQWDQGPDAPSHGGKNHVNATILPTGSVLITGGMTRRQTGCQWAWEDVSFRTWLYAASGSGSWTLAGGATIDYQLQSAPADDTDQTIIEHGLTCETLSADESRWRNQGQYLTPDAMRAYHSTAVLLPNASVLTAGTDMYKDGSYGPVAECDKYVSRTPTIFYPPYFYRPGTNQKRLPSERPRVIYLPREETYAYGETAMIEYRKADEPYAAAIKSVALVRPSSVTHSVNFDQMLVRCQFFPLEFPVNHMAVTMPWSSKIAPPGWYMMYLVDANDVPSEAVWVRIDEESSGGYEIPGELGEFGGGDRDEPGLRLPTLRFELRRVETDSLAASYSLPLTDLDEQGRFVLRFGGTIPEGQYRLRVLPYENWLGKSQIVTLVRNGRTAMLLLENGDANGDNVVDSEDMFQIADAAGRYVRGDRRDLNKDGWIDAADLAIALRNLGRQGD